jgi:hypothetical protein
MIETMDLKKYYAIQDLDQPHEDIHKEDSSHISIELKGLSLI